MTEPADLDAVEARRLIEAAELSPVELLESTIERIELVDPPLNAMVTRAFDRARTEARAAEAAVRAGDPLGPLHGLPVAIKDIQATEGIRTTYGSPDFADNIPTEDDGIVERVRAAGGIVIGKTNVPERSIGANTVNRLFGATGNPFNVDLTCGGSSGGSAVAVATGMAALATGSDHGGSLRIPACYCGVVGIRATPGVVPNEQRTITQTNYSVQGPIGRTVADAALLLSAITERTPRTRQDPMAFPLDAASFRAASAADPSTLRVAIAPDLGGVLVSDEIRRTFESRMTHLKGHVSRMDPHPIDLTEAPGVDWHLRQDVFVTQYSDEAEHWDDGFNPNVRATYDSALQTPMDAIARARRTQMRLYQSFTAIFEDYDIVIAPGVSVPPFPWKYLNPQTVDGHPVENYMAWLALTASLTVVGHPVVALPAGLDEQGTPFGVQVIGRAFGEPDLLSAAMAIEAAFAADPLLARPVPDIAALAAAESTTRTEGLTVQGQ